jgi:hypothetical protein
MGTHPGLMRGLSEPPVVSKAVASKAPAGGARQRKRKDITMIFRTLLAATTALSLTIPAAVFAQTDARETVRGVLENYGYDVSEMDRLSNSQVAEIYLVATGEDAADVRVLLSSMDLTDADMMPADFERTTMIDDEVRAIHEANGYEPSAIEYMSNNEVAQIYLAATTGDTNDLGQQLEVMNLSPMGDMADAAQVMAETRSNIDQVVATRLTSMGYAPEQIDSLSDEETAEVYLALTSEDAAAVQTAVEGALGS